MIQFVILLNKYINDDFFKKLMTNKSEKEKFARENYFMKKPNEEIFILVVDSTNLKRADK